MKLKAEDIDIDPDQPVLDMSWDPSEEHLLVAL